MVPSPQTAISSAGSQNSGPGVEVPSPFGVAPAVPSVRASTSSTIATITVTRYHHQYSLRLARPVKSAYFLKKRWTAWPREAP